LRLESVIRFLDESLKTSEFRNDRSLNGLQVECSKRIKRIATAVDVSEGSIRRAALWGADLLVVHHGLFWSEPFPLTGVMACRTELLFSKGISLYASHIPLDCHPDIGNNAGLASLAGLVKRTPFGNYYGMAIGICGPLARPISPQSLSRKLKRKLGGHTAVFPFGPAAVKKLGIVSGNGASLVQDAAGCGCDALLTGETSHSAFHIARESRINLICAGHYATETLGVKALGGLLQRELGLSVRFIDLPTGL
jgi:dinuclear metal center YbgI/SA1388 family protein